MLVVEAGPGAMGKDTTALAKRIQEYGRRQVTSGQIKRPEALSIANLKNAIRCLREDGTFQINDGQVEVDAALRDAYSQDLQTLLK